MLPALAALIDLQTTDSAADVVRRRLAELPKTELELAAAIAAASRDVDTARANAQASQTARRALEKDVAAVDSRLARFDEHKAAVKTNQEYTALLNEISTAKTEKDGLEERILLLMEEADALAVVVKSAEDALAEAKQQTEAARAALAVERTALDQEAAALDGQRTEQRARVGDKRALAIYDQLLKNRRGLAVARMEGDICSACHVRLRPQITQLVRRNEELVQCESCQRILYYVPPAQNDAPAAS